MHENPNRHHNATKALISENKSRLRKWFRRDGELHQFAIQEVFWSATAELIAAEIRSRSPPNQIRAGRNRSQLDVPATFWDELRQELGILDPEVRERMVEVLRIWLLGDSAQRTGARIRLTEPLPLALILFTGVLERLGRHGSPLSFVLELSELERVAYDDFYWLETEEINVAALARQLLLRSATRLAGFKPNILEIPYHGYWRQLDRLLDLQNKKKSSAQGVQLPNNFLVEGLRAELSPPPQPTHVAALEPPQDHQQERQRETQRSEEGDQELAQLYDRLDTMQRSSPARILAQMLEPLLVTSGDPIEALVNAAASAEGLAKDLVLACRTVLHGDGIELIGNPGDLVDLSLPCSDFQLEATAVGSGRDVSRGRFRILRRGLRYQGTVVLPAKVAPASTPNSLKA